MLIWSLNHDVGNGLNIANDVNVNVKDVNDVNGARQQMPNPHRTDSSVLKNATNEIETVQRFT